MKKLLLVLIAALFTSSIADAQIKVNSTGNVVIGNETPGTTYKLEIIGKVKIGQPGYGNIYIDNSGYSNCPNIWGGANVGTPGSMWYGMYAYHYATDSDERLKENIRDISNSLDLILKLNGKKYDYKTDPKDDKKLNELKKNQAGYIAQEVINIIPEVVLYDDSVDIYSIDYTKFIPFITEAIKEQQLIIENLQSENQELKIKVASIEENCCTNKLKSASIATGTTLAENKAQLDQNIPNPFSKETRIGCFIPEGSVTSILYIYNMNGTQLQQYNINGLGKQSVTINGSSFEPGG